MAVMLLMTMFFKIHRLRSDDNEATGLPRRCAPRKDEVWIAALCSQ